MGQGRNHTLYTAGVRSLALELAVYGRVSWNQYQRICWWPRVTEALAVPEKKRLSAFLNQIGTRGHSAS